MHDPSRGFVVIDFFSGKRTMEVLLLPSQTLLPGLELNPFFFPGSSIPVVRLLWEQIDRVRFPAPRPEERIEFLHNIARERLRRICKNLMVV